MAMVAKFDLVLEQMDVKTTFLYGKLDEVILMKQPEGFEIKGKEDYVCKLNKFLYGLKQSPGSGTGDLLDLWLTCTFIEVSMITVFTSNFLLKLSL